MNKRQVVLVRFVVLSAMVAVGLFAWEPLPVGSGRAYADDRAWLGVPNAANVLVNVPIFWLAVWGWCSTRTSRWPRAMRLPWQWFHLWAMAAALSAAMHHAAPGHHLLVIAQSCLSGAFTMLSLALLAERIDARFGTVLACAGVSAAIALVGLSALGVSTHDDGLPFWLMHWVELTPLLLMAAGALRLRTGGLRGSDWALTVALYASARLLGLADTATFRATGWVSGHTLMHLAFALIVGWMAYLAASTRRGAATGVDSSPVVSQRNSSLNTTL